MGGAVGGGVAAIAFVCFGAWYVLKKIRIRRKSFEAKTFISQTDTDWGEMRAEAASSPPQELSDARVVSPLPSREDASPIEMNGRNWHEVEGQDPYFRETVYSVDLDGRAVGENDR